MKRTALAYCAMRVVGDCTQPTYSERVCVKQVETGAVDLLHSLFGGYRFKASASAKNGRTLEGWQVTDQKAAAFLKAVKPYLRIKAKQADNCLELRLLKNKSKKLRVAKKRGHVGSAHRTEQMSLAMEALYARAKELNRVGV